MICSPTNFIFSERDQIVRDPLTSDAAIDQFVWHITIGSGKEIPMPQRQVKQLCRLLPCHVSDQLR